jgi:hypothetical protein
MLVTFIYVKAIKSSRLRSAVEARRGRFRTGFPREETSRRQVVRPKKGNLVNTKVKIGAMKEK